VVVKFGVDIFAGGRITTVESGYKEEPIFTLEELKIRGIKCSNFA